MRTYLIYLAVAVALLSCSESYDGELALIHPEAGDGFEYPYFLFIPNQVSLDQKTFVIVEPNNSGFADDDLQKHIVRPRKARRASNWPLGCQIDYAFQGL